MAYLDWEDKYKVNIKDVDDQHQYLMKLLDVLYNSVVEGSERTVLGNALDELIQYTVYHFQVEEDMFEKFNYPDKDKHTKEHNELTKAAVDLQNQFKEGSATVSFEVLDFLRNWRSIIHLDQIKNLLHF